MALRPAVPPRVSLLLVTVLGLGVLACKDSTAPNPATKLAFATQPASTAVGATMAPPVTVVVQDADGNTVTTATNSITLAIGTNPGGGTLSGTTTTAAVNGVATFSDLRIGTAGTGYTLAATSPTLTSTLSTPFAVVAGPASKLVFIVQPAQTTAGVTIAPAVRVAVQDAAGNTVMTASGIISVALGTNPGSGTLAGTTSLMAMNGVATFTNLHITTAGTGYTLTASSPSFSGATSIPFAVVAGPASRVGFTVHPAGTNTGATITPAVAAAIQDPFGNTISTATNSITVAIGTNPGNGTLSGITTVAAVNGVATFPNLSINNAGAPYTLTASSGSLAVGTSAAFRIGTPLVFATISAGYFHSCGLTTGGVAYCWGENLGGQLGAAVGPQSSIPVPVSGGLTFAKLTAGRTHTCGVTPGGIGYCWGDNSLGSSTTLPTAVPAAVAGGLTFAAVVAGYGHSCGVTTGGAGYCWGFNGSGEIGNATVVNSTLPAAVSAGLSFASISPGRIFTCGLTTAAAAYCWGFNTDGELGDGTQTSRSSPVPVIGQLSFSLVSAGGFHACGLTTGGVAHCWGRNEVGQLGNSPLTFSTAPRPVTGGLVFAMLSAGNRHTCGVTPAGVGYCWGDNFAGLLGNGTTTVSSTPVVVSGGLTFATISAGRFHTCGVTTAGAAYCWGNAGALGDGTNEIRLVPARVF